MVEGGRLTAGLGNTGQGGSVLVSAGVGAVDTGELYLF